MATAMPSSPPRVVPRAYTQPFSSTRAQALGFHILGAAWGFFAHHIQVALQHHRRGGLVAFSGGLYDNDIIAGVTGMLQAAVFGELLAVIGDFLGIAGSRGG